MLIRTIRRISLLVVICLCILVAFPGLTQSAPPVRMKVKELNFVFLHGMGGDTCTFQLLSDFLEEHLPTFAFLYEQANPGTTLHINIMARCYPGYEDIDTWARNIVDSIDEHFGGKDDLILVGHSMGGKAALYAVSQNIKKIADKVAAVVTINSPIKKLERYYTPGGSPVLEYCQTLLLGADEGICDSILYWDSSQGGELVSTWKYWLAFISAEKAPLSPQFDRAGVDVWPRDMDDGVVPMSAQYSDGADVVYYGEHGHSDFAVQDEVASLLADRILRYILGESIECAVLARGGDLEQRADWLLGTDRWDNVFGEAIASIGTLRHTNDSWTEWREWEDVVGECPAEFKRSRTQVMQMSFPLLTGITELRWLNPADPYDCRLYVKTRAAPRNTVRVNWAIYHRGLLAQGVGRSHYEVEITGGTPLATVIDASWLTTDPRDIRLRLWSEAQSPFRWFKAEWRAYYTESRRTQIINQITEKTLWRDD
jgi:pimeloyl-ACP methyl ester carboxylesterase